MTPRPTFNPHPESFIPYDQARRSFDAELMAWAAETMVEAVDRYETWVKNSAAAQSPCEQYGHSWNWFGPPPSFCTSCGLETHS